MDKDSGIKGQSEPRKRAEQALVAVSAVGRAASRLSPEEMAGLLHELQVHQVELEMQNEELRRIQGELERERDRYSHLYDFAPAGYLTVDEDGMISAANLTAAAMLQRERSELLAIAFSGLVAREDQDVFYLHRQELLADECNALRSCQLHLLNKNGDALYTRLVCLKVYEGPEKGVQIRVSVIDISAQKRAEEDLLRTQEQERKWIAYELHDNIAQNFALLKLTCNQLLKSAQLPADVFEFLWAELSDRINAAIDEIRRLATDLRPDMLDQMGLVKAIEIFCDAVAQQSDIEINLQTNGIQEALIDPEIQIQIYRLVQEGVNNVIRHTAAGRAWVEMATSTGEIILHIEDDGKGFDEPALQPASQNDRRMDLQSMRGRVQLLRGQMEIQSQPKQGTRIAIKFPLPPFPP